MKEIYIPVSLFTATKRTKFRIGIISNNLPTKAIINHIKIHTEPNKLYGIKMITKLIFDYFKQNNINLTESMISITKSDLINYFECIKTTYGNYIRVKQ